MLPYILILFLVILWIWVEKKSLNRDALWIPLSFLILFASFRNYRVGTDTGNYVKNFISQLNYQYFNFNDNVEIGYQLIEYSLLRFTHNYFWLLFVTSFIVVFCYLYVFKKYSKDYISSVFIFITLGTYTFFFNGLRQGIAMAIFALAIPYLVKRKFSKYFLICILASFFHSSALLMLPFYFLVNLNIRILYKITLAFLSSLLLSKFLITYIATTNQRYESYSQTSENSGGLITLAFYVVVFIIMYISSYLYKIKDREFLQILTFYSVGVVFMIPVALLESNPSGPQRLLPYFTWVLALILPYLYKKINNKYIYIISFFFALIYFYLTTSRFSNLTPYTINPIFEIF
ncbi:EpsG family protein [Acinetobacter radioresistens]|uniref:EpsG family protein n=1 Tax=Acinetobacter radioresistens TaxID=40216 RepID=UPI00031E452E|nr:EpsG family protein [Acinetobacter radioresistens]